MRAGEVGGRGRCKGAGGAGRAVGCGGGRGRRSAEPGAQRVNG